MKVEQGKTVVLDYEGRLESGEVFDTSKHGDHSHPLEFEVGAGMVIPGFEEAVMGMSKDEEKEFSIEPENAYGPIREELKRPVPKEMLPKEKEPEVGMYLMMASPNGDRIPAKICEIKDNEVILDLNHPLAGKKLIFKIKILDVK